MKAIRLGQCGNEKDYMLVWNDKLGLWLLMCDKEVCSIYDKTESLDLFNKAYDTLRYNDTSSRNEHDVTKIVKELEDHLCFDVQIKLLCGTVRPYGGREDKNHKLGVYGIIFGAILYCVGVLLFAIYYN